VKRSIGAFSVLAALLVGRAPAPAAELPALHAAPNKPTKAPGETGKGFDIPGSGLHVTFGGYIEGAVIATLPQNAAAASPTHRHKQTP
jgi:hypothetical protein